MATLTVRLVDIEGAAEQDRVVRIWLDTANPLAQATGGDPAYKTVYPAPEEKITSSTDPKGVATFDLIPSDDLIPRVPYLVEIKSDAKGATIFGPAPFYMPDDPDPNAVADLGDLLRIAAQAPGRTLGTIGYKDLYIEGSPSATTVVGYNPATEQLRWKEEGGGQGGGLATDMSNLDSDLRSTEKEVIRGKLGVLNFAPANTGATGNVLVKTATGVQWQASIPFTSEEKTKLAGIASEAEVNVQADLAITDTNSDAFVKNNTGEYVKLDASGFGGSGNLSTNDNTLQKVAQAVNDLIVTAGAALELEGTRST